MEQPGEGEGRAGITAPETVISRPAGSKRRRLLDRGRQILDPILTQAVDSVLLDCWWSAEW